VYESDGIYIHENKNHKGLGLQMQTAFKEFTLPVTQKVKKQYGWRNEEHYVPNSNTWKLELGTNLQGKETPNFYFDNEMTSIESPILWIWADPDFLMIWEIIMH